MNFFKQQTEQARATLAMMPMQSRVIMGLLLLAIGVGLAFLVRGEIDTKYEPLFGGRAFSEQELAAVELSLSRASLSDWKREGTRLMIPSESKSAYLAAMDESSSLPMSIRSNLEEALNKASVFDSAEMRRAREMHAKEKDLARNVMSFPDVRHATVSYDQGERTGLTRQRPQSASVVVQPLGTTPLEARRIRAIQDLVRGAFSGMNADDVIVTDLNGVSSTMLDDEDPMLRKQQETELWFKQKVQGLLVGFPAKVEVSAEIDPTMDSETTKLNYNAEPTTIATDSRKVESTTSKPSGGGVPGVEPNALSNRSVKLEDVAQTSKIKEDERQTRSVTGQEYENSRIASLQVKRIRVSVGLPRSFYQTLYVRDQMRANPDLKSPDGVKPMDNTELERFRTETVKSIQDAVTPLLPEGLAGEDRSTFVTVWDYPDPETVEVETAETSAVAMTWLANSWQTVAMIGLGLVALLVARSAARSGNRVPSEFDEGFGLKLPEVEIKDEDPTSPDNMTITGESLQGELAKIIDGNPEVAANVIRGWIGEAA
jgi:flagellar M-ring protein FliF